MLVKSFPVDRVQRVIKRVKVGFTNEVTLNPLSLGLILKGYPH